MFQDERILNLFHGNFKQPKDYIILYPQKEF